MALPLETGARLTCRNVACRGRDGSCFVPTNKDVFFAIDTFMKTSSSWSTIGAREKSPNAKHAQFVPTAETRQLSFSARQLPRLSQLE